MTVTQSYQLVNDALKQAFGQDAIQVLDVTSLNNVGKFLGGVGSPNLDLFNNAMLGRMIKTVMDAEKLTFEEVPFIVKEDYEYGDFWQEVYPEWIDAIETESWKTADANYQRNLQPIRKQLLSVKIYSKDINTHSYEWNIPDKLLNNAFVNAQGLIAYVNAIGLNVQNAVDGGIAEYGQLVRATYIAKVLNTPNTQSKVNLLALYNEKTGSSLTAETCKFDKAYLKFRAKTLKDFVDALETPGSNYINEKTANNNDYIRQCSPENLIIEVLKETANEMRFYLESDTYHKSLVEMPEYHEVQCWQGKGNGVDFASHSTIKLKLGEDALEQDITVEQSGIIALMYDKRAIRETYRDMHRWSNYDGRERMTYFGATPDVGFAFKLSYPVVVFVEEDVNP